MEVWKFVRKWYLIFQYLNMKVVVQIDIVSIDFIEVVRMFMKQCYLSKIVHNEYNEFEMVLIQKI